MYICKQIVGLCERPGAEIIIKHVEIDLRITTDISIFTH